MSELTQQSLPWDEAVAPLPIHPLAGYSYNGERDGYLYVLRNSEGKKAVTEPIGHKALMTNLGRYRPDDTLRGELLKIEALMGIEANREKEPVSVPALVAA